MDLVFERGSADAPVGHALVFFTNLPDGTTSASYVVVLPIALELTKYVPPLLAAQMPLPGVASMSAVPLPPIPEPVESVAALRHLAAIRHDDLIAGGEGSPSDLGRMMTVVGEIAQEYARLYEEYLQRAPSEETQQQLGESTVSDVIFGLLSEQQKLAELAKLAGQLRYAVDGNDQRQVDEIADELTRLGRYLPQSYDLPSFIDAVKQPGQIGRELSTLFLDRCYKLANEDYAALEDIDREIQRLRGLL